MKTTKTLLSVAAIILAGSVSAIAQSVTYEVEAINVISASGASLTISSATAGSAPNQASDNAGTFAISTNGSNMKITAVLNSDMPSGVTLKVGLAAPSAATSLGAKTLSTSAVDLVTGISTLNASGLAMAYTLDATVAAGVVASAQKTVTYTVTSGI